MAFDYGSIDLGLKNPFKKEGIVTAIRGGIQTLFGIFLLIKATGSVKEDAVLGWILVVFGIYLLAGGIRALGGGLMAIMRYFVGRNHPTSLAKNYSKSESSTAEIEAKDVAYDNKILEEMLVGRKNSTFVEPIGFLARLIHSFLPKLLFMPYPIRNMAQTVFGAWMKTAVAVVAFAFVAFVSLAGFAGEAGKLVFPFYSVLLIIYLLAVWWSASHAASRNAEKKIASLGGGDLVKVITVSIIMPVVIAVVFSWIMKTYNLQTSEVEAWLTSIPSLHSGLYLIGLLVIATLCTALFVFLLRGRLSKENPLSEVSELRENWQESVHPNEIFINLDNLVMANRRYKEVPNRVYMELDPKLNEQVDGKGDFKAKMIQEIQPKVKTTDYGSAFYMSRMISLVSGNVFILVGIVFTLLLAFSMTDIYLSSQSLDWTSFKTLFGSNSIVEVSGLIATAIHFLLIGFIFKSFGSLLANSAHLFFAEIQFESLLIYFKCEGTFTESKISTGTGIHDSTRSENTLIRSSITPWIIVSRIVSSTFAATGLKNLEHPRHILEMQKSDQDLQSIKSDVIQFLKDRESIAAITSERDLGNASQIHQLNEQTRAVPTENNIQQDDEAAGYLRQESDLIKSEPTHRAHPEQGSSREIEPEGDDSSR